ncbi:helix-turn-helix domain-containing protein [Phenylobacterium sp. 58.2.17]|uniref:helix-turn-helix domain-containing protein n=1 Tax=Phenylobacterium sp. 58.2.17 TaxID=2969306 RepID=UPI0022654283|nr:helix-turn-helix domain-containing protein [Phenylobacterium sp. 58.2.17]MCX7586567.1 hypothetical protein [Phenylobacterium sp. 58.2.17]
MAGQVTFAQILKATAQAERLTVAELKGSGRRFYVCRPRQRAMYLALELRPDFSLPFVGARLNKHHTTVLHAQRQVRRRLVEDVGEIRSLARIVAQLAAINPTVLEHL